MKLYKELEKIDAFKMEQKILKEWKEKDIFQKSIDSKDAKDNWVFYDGPIYANAAPGIHHVFAKTIKDAFTKYQTMQGHRVLRKIGLDTHGLPIEVNVEKKLGFKTKSDIEKFGIENFCKECNKATATNIDEINKVTDIMGQFIDCDNPYVTCSNEYIESEWWILKEMYNKGLVYHGNKVLWYCPRCGTELSSNEVSQGYQEDSVNSLILPFKLQDEDTYFLVWTTTPWTLIANVALCVNPELNYLKVKSMGYTFIICETLANSVLGDEYEILKTYKGTDLVGIKYEQLMPFIRVEGKSFEVLADSYVTDSDGTGIVHMAPAYGEDDNRVCRENNVGYINPVGSDGCYTDGPWKGRLVTDKDLEIEIIKYLKDNDKLFRKIKINHDYPHCWRCHSPLIQYPKPAWYVKTTAYKDKIIASNKKINWYPKYIGEKRFANWLENMVDWGISRNRYWGCPIPIWKCEHCNNIEIIGSLEELQEKIIEDLNVKEIELHRPYVDELHIKCKCGKTMSRITDVMDVWFDSGVMPYAQFHYPFENKELFESQFPADFIAEGVDQTRGWFYVLLVISTIISGESSFKNVVVNDMMLDAEGKKMSKSTGNIIDPVATIQKYGADNVRWYMCYASPVWTPLKFDIEGLKEVYSKFFNPFKNTYNFFAMYANTDKIDIKKCDVPFEKRDEIDRWLISKYNNLLKKVTDYYNDFDLNKVTREITSFVSDDLSNWYIRRNRDRFWKNELDTSKKAVYITTYEILLGVCKIIAPIVPFLSDEIYINLTKEESVHLADYPKYNSKLINEELEEKMDLVRDLISIGRNIREAKNIKVRQPLKEVLLDGRLAKIIDNLDSLILEELNIKKLTFIEDLSKYMDFTVKPNYKVVGKIFGPHIKELENKLQKLTNNQIMDLEKNITIKLEIDNSTYDIDKSMVDIRFTAKDGFDVDMNNNLFVILDTTLTKELLDEGIAREFVSKIQQIRKNMGLDIADRIKIVLDEESELKQSLINYEEYIKNETLAKEIIYSKGSEEIKINEITIKVSILKI